MADLPARHGLDHLRRQARDLLRAARAGDTTAAGRIRAVADALTLASAQLAVAREYGFASWMARLRAACKGRLHRANALENVRESMDASIVPAPSREF